MNDEEMVQYFSDLAEGMSETNREKGCGRRCIMFGIQMGYNDEKLGITKDVPLCNCEMETKGYKLGRELNGRPMNWWEKLWGYLR